jgi:hypothetical protein
MARSRGYSPYASSEAQDALLDRIVSRAHDGGEQTVGVFDLDGCLFDTRPRQIQIFREFANRSNRLELYRVAAEHFKDWDLSNTLRHAGFSEAYIEEVAPAVAEYWRSRFFRSDTVVHDHAMPGAVDLVRRCHAGGMRVAYLTGRDETMRAGTSDSLRAFGFPLDGEASRLFVKPDFDTDDTIFKDGAMTEIAKMGTPTLFLDNEPSNVNTFRSRFPDALVVFVETDHSPKPVEPHPDIPWIRSFFPTGVDL